MAFSFSNAIAFVLSVPKVSTTISTLVISKVSVAHGGRPATIYAPVPLSPPPAYSEPLPAPFVLPARTLLRRHFSGAIVIVNRR